MTNCPQDLINCPGYNFPVHRYPQNGCGCPPPNSPVICIGAVLPNKQDVVFSNSNLFANQGKAVRTNTVHDIAANEDAAVIKYDQNTTFRQPFEAPPKVSRQYTNIGLDNAQGKSTVTFAINGGTESRVPNDNGERSPAIIDGNLLEPDIDYFFQPDVCTLPPNPLPCPSPSPSTYYQVSPSPSTYYQISPSPSIYNEISPSPSTYYQTSPSPEINYPSPSTYYPQPSQSIQPSPQASSCVSDGDCCICKASSGCGQTCGECSCPPGTECRITDDILTPAGCFEVHAVDCNIITNSTDCLNTFGPSDTGGYWTYVSGYCCNGNCQDTPCS